MRFITDERTNETFAKWLQERTAFMATAKMEKEFMERRIRELETQSTKQWDDLFKRLQEEGLIPQGLKREDFCLEYSSASKPIQLFMTSKAEDDDLVSLMREFWRARE